MARNVRVYTNTQPFTYNPMYSENNDPSAVRQFAWIPDEVLQMSNVSAEIR